LSNVLAGKAILVTGGAGAFGQAFVRYALNQEARKVVVFSRSESSQAAMRAAIGDDRLRFAIGDIRDYPRLLDAMRGIDIVIHSAALKRVEVCEAQPNEAVATNITGTQNVARACIERGVRQAVLLSTDKAAAANTLYGMTKATAERLWVSSNIYSAGTKTRFACTRYGNVINSTGSVVPVWREQAKQRRSITMTNPEMSRFWMRMEDAIELVVLTLTHMRGGEIRVPKLGSCPINLLAYVVAPDADWLMVGARPGEKLHEVLITPEEARHTYDAGDHFIIEPESRPWGEIPAPAFPLLLPNFSYDSHTNHEQLSDGDLRELIAA
jgi:UDP-N-acetylglucosamine 4,6-dehydratase